jgi:sialic acid synthase
MRTKIILEIGCNHNGSMTQAKKMIREASKLGVWAVKFQKRDINSIPEKKKKQKRTDEHAYGSTYYLHRKALEFSIKEIAELKEYAEENGLTFICSAFDLKSANELVGLELDYIKLPSQCLQDNQLFKYLIKSQCQNGRYVLASCGMHTIDEVARSAWTRVANCKLFHCVSEYPADSDNTQLGVFRLGLFSGYSSHEIGGLGCKYAVAAGAEYIERHFTLDKTDKGSDHKISSDPDEVKEIIGAIEVVEKYCGPREISDTEQSVAKAYRGNGK